MRFDKRPCSYQVKTSDTNNNCPSLIRGITLDTKDLVCRFALEVNRTVSFCHSHVIELSSDVGSAIKLAAALPPSFSLHTTNGRLPTQTLVSETQGSLEKDLVCVPLVLDKIGGFITFGKPEGTWSSWAHRSRRCGREPSRQGRMNVRVRPRPTSGESPKGGEPLNPPTEQFFPKCNFPNLDLTVFG